MSNSDPTPKQLAFLKSLALRRGQTFVIPTTRREASDEIEGLLGGKRRRRQRPGKRERAAAREREQQNHARETARLKSL